MTKIKITNKKFHHNIKVLLIGIGGVYNYGCEAIVRGIELILRSKWPDSKIIYASLRVEDDRARLNDTSINIVQRTFNRYSLSNISRKIVSYVGLNWNPRIDTLNLLKGVDAVFSIGGDIYTLDSFDNYNVSLPRFGNAAEKRRIPYILWGASVGPFNKNKKAEKFFSKHLSNISLVAARENDTIDYLSSIGVSSNVISCADPAFVVAPEILRNCNLVNDKKTIGINLSPLPVRYSGMDLEKTLITQARMVEQIAKKFNAKVILIPHVVCNFAIDNDDKTYLQKIILKIDRGYKDQIYLIDTDLGFIGVKKILAQCDLVIATRMHCAINSIAAFVPTIFIAYSQKAQGMCDYIYGHRKWVLSLADFSSEKCLTYIGLILKNQKEIQTYLSRRILEVRANAYAPLVVLEKLLSNKV